MDDAYHHISSFSDLLRSYMASSRNKFITLADEIENLQNYIMLQQARFEGRFNYKLHAGAALPVDTIVLPPFLLQPFVENAINHGLFHLSSGGFLSIRFMQGKDNKELICIIEDNGVGRERAKELRSKSAATKKSLGMKLTEDRLALLGKQAQTDASVEVEDLKTNDGGAAGTKVIIKIPVD